MSDSTRQSASLLNHCRHQLRLFFVALQFFTRIPVPRWVGFQPEWQSHSLRYFPLAGIVVAAITGAGYEIAACIWSQPVAVILSIIVGIYLTGALHEDGLADVCDGFGGGANVERVMQIMKDSRVGAYGVIGIVLMLFLKSVLLSDLPKHAVTAALFIAHPMSRLAAMTLILRLDYVRSEGKAAMHAQRSSMPDFLIAAAIGFLPVLAIGGLRLISWTAILVGMIGAGFATLYFSRVCVRRIGGYTGDCLGAAQQIAEVMIYLMVLACVGNGVAY